MGFLLFDNHHSQDSWKSRRPILSPLYHFHPGHEYFQINWEILNIKYIKVKVTTNMLLSINGALFSGLDSFPFQIPAAFLDIRYDQVYMSLDQKLESVQYNAL